MFELRNVSLWFGPQRVLDNVDFSLAPGERVGVIGPSGAGKSSLLKLAAGLLEPSTGQCVNTFRHPVLVFQEPRLLPWRSITENIEIPLLAAGMDKNQATRQAAHWLERVGLANAGARWPRELSGGMAQRAALARAMALQPDCLLLDEPFSALDQALRESLGALCRQCVLDTGAALLCISHHPQELVRIVDRCVRISDGRLHDDAIAIPARTNHSEAAPSPTPAQFFQPQAIQP